MFKNALFVAAFTYFFLLVATLILFPDAITLWGDFLRQFDGIVNDQGLWIFCYLLPIMVVPYILSFGYVVAWNSWQKRFNAEAKRQLSLLFIAVGHAIALYAFISPRVNDSKAIIFLSQLEVFTVALVKNLKRRKR